MSTVIDNFLRYIQIDTISDHFSETNPSTQKQFDLAKLLVEECNALGLKNVVLTQKCHILAELPGNTDKDVPVIGFNAHMDTSPDYSGTNVTPSIIEYTGGDLILNKETGITLSPEAFPFMNDMIGQHLIVPDGTTLLGADDKAGVAAIMSAMEYLIDHPEIKHGTVKICFTPDEEIGRGVEHFQYDLFGADFAYTVDGGPIGTITYENFNAASAKINITGKSIHPGTAKGKMVNAGRIAMELDAMLPVEQKPEYTEKYEGFFHLLEIKGSITEASLWYIIRDHNMEKFIAKKQLIQDACNYLNTKYGDELVKCEVKDSYYNMKEKIVPVMHIIDNAIAAMEELGIEPRIEPIRGGTDGARMSYQGLPTPNLFYGGYNAHGPYEFAVVEEMEKTVQVIVKIIERYAKV